MNDLIPIDAADKIKHGYQLVDARILHSKLEVQTRFDDWMRRRIEEYGFEEGTDYYPSLRHPSDCGNLDSSNLRNQEHRHGGDRRSINYHLTLRMAMELAMVERTEVGRKVRRYFIEMEQQARALLEERANQVQPIEQVKKKLKDTASLKFTLILQDQSRKIAKELSKETDHGVRYNLHCQLRQVNECLGVPTLSLAELTANRPIQIE